MKWARTRDSGTYHICTKASFKRLSFVPLLPYFMYMGSEGSGETVFMCRLVEPFAAGRCDTYQNLMY